MGASILYNFDDHHDMKDMMAYIGRLSATLAQGQPYGAATDFIEQLASETAYRALRLRSKQPHINKQNIRALAKQSRSALQARYRQGREYSCPSAVSGTRISFAKKLGVELDRFEQEYGREPTARERQELMTQIREEWPDRKHRPPLDMMDPPIIVREQTLMEAVQTPDVPLVDDMIEGLLESRRLTVCDVWGVLLPNVEGRSLPEEVVVSSIQKVEEHRDRIREWVRDWRVLERWQFRLLFAPFLVETNLQRDCVAGKLCEHLSVAADLLILAYKRSLVLGIG